MDLLYAVLALAVLFFLGYWFLTKSHGHWRRQNIPSMPNPLPGIGHMWPVLSFTENISPFVHNIYKSTDASMIGFDMASSPVLLVRDPELVKAVFQTKFTSFHENAVTVNEKYDPVMAKNPFLIRDLEQWKAARARAISHFSSKKLRDLFVIVREVASKLNAFIDRKIKENNGIYECELKALFTRFTGEIVANAAFAMEGQCFEDNPHKMSFAKLAPSIFEPTLINGIKQAIFFYFPNLAELLRISFLDKKTETYFRENLKAIIKERRQANVTQNDYLQFCIDANSEDDINSIIADVIIFQLDAYETSSIVLSFLFWNLTAHQEVQSKLREHIHSTLKPTGGTVTYESLKGMNYLEQVLNESLRVTPPATIHMKACTEETTLVGSDGLQARLKPGDRIFISSLALHMDPKYWKDPEVFDPERHTPENQSTRTKNVFFPFGEGPRMCLGMRFAIIMIKMATSTVLENYDVEYSNKTKVPFELDPSSFLITAKGGLWAKFKKRN